jgi:hypothetical protein
MFSKLSVPHGTNDRVSVSLLTTVANRRASQHHNQGPELASEKNRNVIRANLRSGLAMRMAGSGTARQRPPTRTCHRDLCSRRNTELKLKATEMESKGPGAPDKKGGPKLGLFSRIKRRLYLEFVMPIRGPYRTRELRCFVHGTRVPILESLLDPLKRHRDRAFVQRLIRPSDIFLVGHPKSGNTWMAYMLAKVLAKENLNNVTLANLENYVPLIHGEDSAISRYEHLQSPRIFRNENPVHPDLYPRTIYLLRDPRSVLVSYYDMYSVRYPRTLGCGKSSGRPLSLQQFVEEYLVRGYVRTFHSVVRWDRHVLSWYERTQQDKTTMLVRYEDMVADRGKVLQSVLNFCGISYDQATLATVVAQGSFEEMRKNEDRYGSEHYSDIDRPQSHFIRRGQTDGWKMEMEPALIRRVESDFGSVMQTVGYELSDWTS